MVDQFLPYTLLLLGAAVALVVLFQRLRVPSSLGYLMVGILFGPYTAGPVIDVELVRGLAELGIVFLLFTVGLNFSLPQIRALRHVVLSLGTAQVALTTLIIGLLAWLLGLPGGAAFVVGAAFAQSSTTVISKQLTDQGEEHSRHGRLAVAMSVFQDVTAASFVVLIPVLGTAVGAGALVNSLAWVFAKAALAFALVVLLGRQLFRPLFHFVAEQRSTEIFTLNVLFVSLVAAWATSQFGLSLAFGAFLAGMVLGETEFRHQVESTIRPFRDVLLGLFFVGIGMLFDLPSLPRIWHLAIAGAAVLLIVKTILVAQIVRLSGIDALTAWRIGWVLAVGGEFGLALLAIALPTGALEPHVGQVVLTSVLFSMIVAPFLIRYNHALAGVCVRRPTRKAEETVALPTVEAVGDRRDHVVICGYGRIGQSVARFLDEEQVPYVALDLDPARAKEAHLAGEPVYYGDAAERSILEAVGIERARLVVISHEDVPSALKVLHHVRRLRPYLPVMVRTRDESHVEELRAAGASEVVPETLEASLMIAMHTLLLLSVPIPRVMRRMQEQRERRYQMLREFFRGESEIAEEEPDAERLRPVVLPPEGRIVGRTLGEIDLRDVVITALVRRGERQLAPPRETRLEAGDALVLFGTPENLERAERVLLG